MISYFNQNKHGEEIEEVGKQACLKAKIMVFLEKEKKSIGKHYATAKRHMKGRL